MVSYLLDLHIIVYDLKSKKTEETQNPIQLPENPSMLSYAVARQERPPTGKDARRHSNTYCLGSTCRVGQKTGKFVGEHNTWCLAVMVTMANIATPRNRGCIRDGDGDIRRQ